MLSLSLVLVALMQGPVIPAPVGYVNDFAGVIDAAHAARIEELAKYVQVRSKGEIVIVTMSDIGQRDVGDVALQIGRQWGVGAKVPVGDPARNAGVVVLVVPGAHGHVAISTGQGAEGFISDAVTGDIRREAVPFFQQSDYGAALELITARLAARYAAEFHFSMDSAGVLPPRAPSRSRSSGGNGSYGFIAIFLVFLVLRLVMRGGGRGGGGGLAGALPWLLLSSMSGRRGGGGSWGGGGFGGGGGGGFGGFGGGGGFSGGGSSGSW